MKFAQVCKQFPKLAAIGKINPMLQYSSPLCNMPIVLCKYSRCAADTRDLFKDHSLSQTGEVQWQYSYIKRTQ